MLAEEDYSTPIDYQDLLYVYAVPRDVVSRTNAWLRRSALFSSDGVRIGNLTRLAAQ